ncbi:hypothetical protein LTR97_009083 [Elasticomyces elasticus]|uniref:Uncharacterized protein n=1 Tax=Elasticomyces elasticus TaxID=574655 RepID=A0AAN7VN40_9PEZI|nr:hypothetical protein LTR97_009083 [Elasticomyces elasticus]
MVFIGSKTRNGKSLIPAGRAKRLAKSAVLYTNKHLKDDHVEKPIFQANRNAFRGPLTIRIPHDRDEVHSAARKVIRRYNNQDFHHLADPITVLTLAKKPTVYHGSKSAPVVMLLVRLETFIKVQSKLIPGLNGASSEVVLRDGRRRIPLSEWLDALPTSRMRALNQAALKLQWEFWGTTGKVFEFSLLPVETRKAILLPAIGEHVVPQRSRYRDDAGNFRIITTLTKGGDAGFLGKARCDPTDPCPLQPIDAALFKVDATTSVLAWQVEAGFKFLRRVQLCFTSRDYTDFIRVDIAPFNTARSWTRLADAERLQKLDLLSELEIFFRAPLKHSTSPWQVEEAERTGVVSNVFIDYDRFPCQKVLADTILCYAAQYVKKALKVTVGGFVKAATKEKWEAVFNQPLEDNFAAIAKQKQDTRMMQLQVSPPPCYCPNPCYYGGIDDVHSAAMDAYHTYAHQGFKMIKHSPKESRYESAYGEYRFDFGDMGLEDVPNDGW